ncbi:hypothetical protein P171DRAFT_439028 [Karstenula rhodostoma CBS 690.94]|uniref:Uncharacterized protein n=1 Tax=Karstenula rhodostoma CBS 690.94 TaxID=1392251 RepID=A0A9P4UIJ4_9PLEO|nr:hypothetical protein P171DRAFT_439028 [Karstenula rhodostoma CBS 690.94]
MAADSEDTLLNNTTASPPGDTAAPPQKKPRLSAGAYAGIGVGCVFGLSFLGAATLVWRRRSKSATSSETHHAFHKAELHGEGKPRLEAMSNTRMELETIEPGHEIKGSQTVPHEMQGSEVPIHELGHTGTR